jgi:lipoprotein-releasing system ATP-binding protein
MGAAAGEPPILEARGVTRVLPGVVPVTLVREVDLTIRAGEFVAITGPSGSGKSSLLYLLGLLDRPTEGQILLQGKDMSRLGPTALADWRLRRMGFVFQFHFLLPEFSVIDNVMIPMRRLGALSVPAMRARAETLLDSLGLATAIGKWPQQLSGGERQRVAIARALANEPPVILADEPTGNLDTRNGEIVFSVFERLVREDGKTVIPVTHDPDLAARCARQVRIVDGRIVEDSGAAAAA